VRLGAADAAERITPIETMHVEGDDGGALTSAYEIGERARMIV
jgi:hypothetical protein